MADALHNTNDSGALLIERFGIGHSNLEMEAPDDQYSCKNVELLTDEH